MMKKWVKVWQRASLRTKWFYSIALTIVGVYAVVCIIIYMALFAWLSENEKSNAVRTVSDLQSYFVSQAMHVSIDDLQQQTGLMEAILTQDQTVRLYTLEGVELLQINDTVGDVPLVNSIERTIDERSVDDMDVYVVQQIITIGKSPVIVQLVHPLTSFQSMMRYISTTMLIMGIGALLMSAIVSYLLAGRFMLPLTKLRNSMLQVKEHGVTANTLQVEVTQDELGDVLHIYNEMLEQLEESFQRQQQFVFDASHELRTPIQAIEGNLNLIKRWGKDDREVLEESINISLEEITRMKKLMEELLQLARQQKEDLHETTDVVQVIESICSDYSAEIYINYDQISISALVSEQAFRQIIRNLVENSIRYCERQPYINITIKEEGHLVVIDVEDNGIGISEKHLPYIFDRFYKADDARLHVEGSTGLGLSIVKMLVEKYNGQIFVSSQKGQGTIFTLQFSRKK